MQDKTVIELCLSVHGHYGSSRLPITIVYLVHSGIKKKLAVSNDINCSIIEY